MITRRQLLPILAALPVGIAGGLATWQELRPRPSVRMIGHEDGLIALMDTGNERVLVLAGEVSEALWSGLAGLLTPGRSRIDVAIGSHRTLTSRVVAGSAWRRSAQILAVQSNVSLPPLAGAVHVVVDEMTMQLGNASRCTVTVAGLADSSAEDGSHPAFGVRCEIDGAVTVIMSNPSVIRRMDAHASTVVALPGQLDLQDAALIRPALFVGTNPRPDDYVGAYRQAFSRSSLLLAIEHGAMTLSD